MDNNTRKKLANALGVHCKRALLNAEKLQRVSGAPKEFLSVPRSIDQGSLHDMVVAGWVSPMGELTATGEMLHHFLQAEQGDSTNG